MTQFIASHDRAPAGLVLDIDASDIPLHGEQELRELIGLLAAEGRQSAAFAQSRTSRRTPILVAVIALCVGVGIIAWSARRNAKNRRVSSGS